MVPHVASRGSSFKGAALYYLHDKKAKTNERVAWTYTHNLPTMNAHKGFNYMASTAYQAEVLKSRANVASTGRKSASKPVYSFSLSWHPEQEPEHDDMRQAALDALAHLGLTEHEAVFIAHNDEPHPHIHIVANLIHPENGKTASTSYDRLSLSAWAEEFERKGGKIYCEERVENNKKRREHANENGKLKLVRHREKRLERAELIQKLYDQTQNTESFSQALEQEGYSLAMGHKNRVVLVDQDGEIFALSRQLKAQRAKDIRAKLDQLDTLPIAAELSDSRKYFMRDDLEAKQQKQIVDAAIAKEEETKDILKRSFEKRARPNNIIRHDFIVSAQDKTRQAFKESETIQYEPPRKSYAEELDEIRAKEQSADRVKLQKELHLKQFYNRKNHLKKLEELKAECNKTILPWQKNKLEGEIKALEKTLGTIDQRMSEQIIKPEQTIYSGYQSSFTDDESQSLKLSTSFNKEAPEQVPEDIEKQERLDKLKAQIRQRREEQSGRDFER